jgi:hypothetical protein
LAACGGGKHSASSTTVAGAAASAAPAAVVKAAGQHTAAGTATFAVSASITQSGIPGSTDGTQNVSGNGNEDFAHQKGQMTATGLDTPQPVQIIFSGKTIWVNADALGGPAGKWALIGPDTNVPSTNGFSLDLSTVNAVLPDQILGLLQRVSDVTVVGAATVAGQPTTEYHVTATNTSILQSILGGSFGGASGLVLTVPMNVYIDHSGRVVQMSGTTDLGSLLTALLGGGSGNGKGPSVTVHLSLDLSKFGVPVTLTPPSGDQLYNAPTSSSSSSSSS